MRSRKEKSISTFVKHNIVINKETFHACSIIFIGLDTLLEKESECKTHMGKNKPNSLQAYRCTVKNSNLINF
jgi:hypothetical protein